MLLGWEELCKCEQQSSKVPAALSLKFTAKNHRVEDRSGSPRPPGPPSGLFKHYKEEFLSFFLVSCRRGQHRLAAWRTDSRRESLQRKRCLWLCFFFSFWTNDSFLPSTAWDGSGNQRRVTDWRALRKGKGKTEAKSGERWWAQVSD